MSQFNVVRGRSDEELPPLLEEVLDGAVEVNDPRVDRMLRDDPAAARRFRDTRKVIDRFAHQPSSPDFTRSVLAVLDADRPIVLASRRPSRVTPARVAFAGGLAAGIAIVGALRLFSVPTPLEPERPAVAVISERELPDTVQVPHVVGPVAAAPARAPFSLGNTDKYEPSTRPHAVIVASNAGNHDVLSGLPMAVALDPCAGESTSTSMAQGVSMTDLVPARAMSSFASPAASRSPEVGPKVVWPPDDLVEWLREYEECPTHPSQWAQS